MQLKITSSLELIYENHICDPRSEELNEGDMIILHLFLHSEVHIYDFHIS